MSTLAHEKPVVRHYTVTPDMPASVNGHKVEIIDPFEVQLSFTDAETISLHRDSAEAISEVIEFARKRGLLPRSVVTANAVCTRERLKKAKRA